MWDVVCITCSSKKLASVLQQELKNYQKKGLIAANAELLAVEDPRDNIGSGGATFNAIFTIAELLSAKNGYAVIKVDCLKLARILILHVGHQFDIDVGYRALLSLPCVYNTPTVTSCIANFLHSYLIVTNHIAVNSPPGTWVVSTDVILSVSDNFYKHIDWSAPNLDMLGLAVPMPVDSVIGRHAAYFATSDGLLVGDLLYKPTKQQLEARGVTDDNQINQLLGVVYLRPWVVESICAFYEIYPINSCTYIGVDSGIDSINLSLFMDVTRAAARNVTEEEFLGNSTDLLLRRAKAIVYERLHHFNYRLVVDRNGKFIYPDLGKSNCSILNSFQQFVNLPMAALPQLQKSHQAHSFVSSQSAAPSTFFINSLIGADVSVGASSIISHSIIEAKRVKIGRKCVINGLTIGETMTDNFEIPDEIVFHQIAIDPPSDEIKEQLTVFIVFGLYDSAKQCVEESSATFCNISWSSYLNLKGIHVSDLWSSSEPPQSRSIFTARMYPLLSAESLTRIVTWLSRPTKSAEEAEETYLRETWRNSWRFSLRDLLPLVSYANIFNQRRLCFSRIAAKLVQRQLANNTDGNLFVWYNTASIDGFADDLLTVIDEVALQCLDEVRLARLFANTATLLGCMSGGRGGMRSGPAGNAEWRAAYAMLKNGNFQRAIFAMTALRSQWLQTPQMIIRAARHYEGAQQQLISKACSTALKAVLLKPDHATAAAIGNRWVVVESPCRIDFAGAWSDTPPVCYEIGGAVLGAAISIKGQLPIGAKVRRIATPVIEVGYLHDDGELMAKWTFQEIGQMADYDSPFSQAALVKACLVAAGIISPPNLEEAPSGKIQESLANQLVPTVGAHGLEIYTWANLPTGSGLGTSSILAGTLIAALWTLRGFSFDATSLVHAVLHFEQLLTTGGGWQDQVHGLVGGVKLAYSSPGLPVSIRWNQVHLDPNIFAKLNSRLLLIYSGKTRLAKNILQNVLRNWYSNDATIVATERELIRMANSANEALQCGNFEAFGLHVRRSHELKQRMAPGSETEAYRKLIQLLLPLSHGYSMCGAGGGGFIYFILKDGSFKDEAKRLIEQSSNLLENENIAVYDSEISTTGMTTRFVN